LDGFEGLQGLWTGGGWDFRPDRFFFGKNQVKKLKKKNTPPSNNFCVVSRNGVNFS
jgi:hypothetical protein